MLAAIIVVGATGCGAGEKSAAAFDPARPINILTREDGSGTRSAFIELLGIEEKNAAGEKIDKTADTAAVTNSTAVMLTTVSGDLYAIGYASLGVLNESVKPLAIDGVAPTAENVANGSYKIARPFNIATKGEPDAAAQDFINFIMSADGQAVIADEGYIPVADAGAYQSGGAAGRLVAAGSSSVTPVMEKLKEAYILQNPDVTIDIQQSDSSTGIADTIDGTCDIGMASRDLKDSELAGGLNATVIAMDGIAVIVNNGCPISGLESTQIKDIFTGGAIVWNEVLE